MAFRSIRTLSQRNDIRLEIECIREGKRSVNWEDAMLTAGWLHDVAVQCEVLADELRQCIAYAESSRATSIRKRIAGALWHRSSGP